VEEESANSVRKQSGWLLIGALIGLEIHWISTKLKQIFSLWQNCFSFEKFEIKSKDNFVHEINYRISALQSISEFLEKCKKLHADNIHKLLATFCLSFYVNFLEVDEKSKKKIPGVDKSLNEVNMAKMVKELLKKQ
jgi:hypothetical protein